MRRDTFQNPFALWNDPIGFLKALASQHDHPHFRLGPYRAVLLTQSQDIERVLLTDRKNFIKDHRIQHTKALIGDGLINSNGDTHRCNRLLVQPAFRPSRLATYSDAMVDEAETFCSGWKDGDAIDAGRSLSALTLQIVGRVIFGADVSADSEKLFETLTAVLKRFGMAAIPFSAAFSRLPLPGFRSLTEAQDRLNERAYAVIAERRQTLDKMTSDDGAPDLLTSLLLAHGEGGTALTDKEVHDEAMTIFLAGHETTATALAWCCHLLSRHWEDQERMAAEIATVCRGSRPSREHIACLPFTNAVFAETLRLYPPIWLMARAAVETYAFPSGIVAPKSALVIVSPLVQHTLPELWQDAEAFRPGRWQNPDPARPRYAYIPFGAGPRVCVGEHFAKMEAILILVSILSRWKLSPISHEQVAPDPLITLRPKTPILVKVAARRPA